jgi:hypothetical protein
MASFISTNGHGSCATRRYSWGVAGNLSGGSAAKENTMFDSPISRCDVVREMVVTDQTQAECAREHGCPPDRICPLCGYFSETSGISAAAAAAMGGTVAH